MEFLGFDIYLIIVVIAIFAVLFIIWATSKILPRIITSRKVNNPEDGQAKIRQESLYGQPRMNFQPVNEQIDTNAEPENIAPSPKLPVNMNSDQNKQETDAPQKGVLTQSPPFNLNVQNIKATEANVSPQADKNAKKANPVKVVTKKADEIMDVFSNDESEDSPLAGIASKMEEVDLNSLGEIGQQLFKAMPEGSRKKGNT